MFLGGASYDGEMNPKVRALVFFLLSVALLVVFVIQKGFTTQSYIWMFLTVTGTAAAFSNSSDFMATAVVALLGISGGMVLGNATIQLK